MRKAKKKIHPMPKLGWKDMLLYWSGMLLTGGGAVFAVFYPLAVSDDIIFQNPEVIAHHQEGGLHFLWLMLWLLTMCCMIVVPYRSRYPVFGRTDIKYGPPAYPRIFPLLMRDKPQYWVSPKKVAFRKKVWVIGAAVMVIWLVLALSLYPRTIYQRSELYQNGSITVFDGDGQEKESYSRGDVEFITIQARSHRGRRSSGRSWYVDFVITLRSGEEFWYQNTTFRGDSEEVLKAMLHLKGLYSCPIRIENTQNLDKVIKYYNLNDYEISLLYQLFE